MRREDIIVTSVVVEPVSLGEIKIHRRDTDDTSEDDYLLALVSAARSYCEKITRRALAPQTRELILSEWPDDDCIEIPMPPLISVTSIKFKDCLGVETTIPASDYIADTESYVGRVVLAYGKTWPSFTPYPVNPIRIRYVAGYENAPDMYKQAINLLVAHWGENREAVLTGTISKKVEFAVDSLLGIDKAGWF